jgi:inorganic pyrophosphatase
MAISSYLEALPLNKIAKYGGGKPGNGVPFAGYPRKHPAEKDKLILVYDPLGTNTRVLEFLLEDVLYVEELPQAVTEAGEGLPMIKLWIRRGAHGVIMEPFEVDEERSFLKMLKKGG